MMINDRGNENGEEGKMFDEWCIPCLKEITMDIKRRHPYLPLIVLARGA